MKKRSIRKVAAAAARKLVDVVAQALRSEDRVDFQEEAERICRRVIKAVERRVRLERINIKESLN
jgi:hypothetical protein